MKKFSKSMIIALALLIITTATVFAVYVPPSTNDINRTNGWAHVDELDKGIGWVELEFIQPRGFFACFEYRTDGDTSQKIADDNYNEFITDGLYPFYCLNNESLTEVFNANEYIEIRMVFGAEDDERFDWTRFDVIPLPVPTEKDQCKENGWMDFFYPDATTFKNQ